MEEREQIENLMRNYGFEEKEAQAAYHLRRARESFEELFALDAEAGVAAVLVDRIHNEVYVRSHFVALTGSLQRRVLVRDYPEGWGRAPKSEEEDSG